MTEPVLVAACAQCLAEYELNAGRGRRSPYCDTCRVDRAKIRAAMRQFSIASAAMIEVSLLYGADLTRRRVKVAATQEGRCYDCNRKRRRLFVVQLDGYEAGVCLQCFYEKEVLGG